MRHSLYHKVLRVNAFLVALVLLFDSGMFTSTTGDMSQSTRQYLASVVGMSASVEPTELNQITAALTAKQAELDAREREINARVQDTTTDTDYSTYILSVILFLLLTLIIMNYIFDFVRARREQTISYANPS